MPTDSKSPAIPVRTLEALSGLRQKVRRLFAIDGAVTLAGGTLFSLAVSFFIDYALTLPRGVRFVLLSGGILAFVYFLQRKIARPLASPISDVDLANLVERANPELSQSLVTAVELGRGGTETAAFVSSSMLDLVVRSVEDRIHEIRFARIFDLRRLRTKMALVVVGALVFVVGALSNTELLAIWVGRDLLLGAERWPKQTHLVLVRPDPTAMPALVAMGDDLEVEVQVARGDPALVIVDSFSGRRLLRSDVLSGSSGGAFHKTIENVSKPFTFSVRGGDDEIGRFEVDVRLRPRIDMQSIQLWCTYPAYTGLESTPEDQPLRHGNLKAPEGTRVRFRMAANIDLGRAFFVFRAAAHAMGSRGEVPAPAGADAGTAAAAPSPAPSPWPDPGAIELAVTDGKRFSGEITVAENGQYYFQLEAVDGFRSLKPDRFRVESIADQKPVVRVLEPERNREEVSSDARVTVRISASDDFRIRKAVLEGVYLVRGKEKGVEQYREFPGFASGTGGDASPSGLAPGEAGAARRALEDEVTIEVSSLNTGGAGPPAPGASFQYVAQAMDFAGHVGESQPQWLEIVEKDDLLRILTDHLMIVRDQLREVLRRQKSARKDLEEFHSQVALKEVISSEDAQKLYRHRQDQGRVTQALEREAGEVSRILQRTARNNVGDEQWKIWVTGIRDDVDGLAKRKSPEIEKVLEGLQKGSARGPQEVSRLNLVSSAQREVEREVESIVMRLSEFGDKNALIQMLRELRRRQTDLREETRERARGAPPQEPQK